jgi:hypothetical protein
VAEGLLGCEMGQLVFVIGHLRQRRWQPEDDQPLETHVVVISQAYTDVIVDRTPIDCMDATPRPS